MPALDNFLSHTPGGSRDHKRIILILIIRKFRKVTSEGRPTPQGRSVLIIKKIMKGRATGESLLTVPDRLIMKKQMMNNNMPINQRGRENGPTRFHSR
jgi:hypothetical protein